MDKLPVHIAIIMDGNGRWAKERSLSRTQGHIEGVKRVEEIVDYANDLGIKAVTLFTFSTENWSRPQNEISSLMNTITAVLQHKSRKLQKNNMKFQIIGRKNGIPENVHNAIHKVEEGTRDNTGLIINLAFNYGSRSEIVDAVRQISQLVKRGQLEPEKIDEETINGALYTSGLPDPDLLIRTSGEQRISNFLLWQLSYAEIYFTDVYWPDFTVEQLNKAILEFQTRERRFGQIDAEGEN